MNGNSDVYLEKIIYYNNKLENMIKLSSDNEMICYLEKQIKLIFNTYSKYDTFISYYVFYAKEINWKEKQFKKIIYNQIEHINLGNEKIMKLLNKNKKIIKDKKKILIALKKNKKDLIIFNNMIFSYINFQNEIEYSKYKKIDYSDLKTGDILLTIKTDKIIKKTLINKLIHKITKSHIIHSTIFLEKEKNKYLFLDVSKIHFLGKTKFKKFRMNYSKNEIGLVLRTKNDLTKDEKTTLIKYLKKNIGSEYGTYKVLFLALKLTLFNLIPTYKNLRNNDFSKAHYCSENVTEIYEKIGILLSNKKDDGTVTPVDLLNSKHLKVVGYIDKAQRRKK